MHGSFGLVDAHHEFGFASSHLAHQFAANRAASTGDEHRAAIYVLAHESVVGDNGCAAQQILYLHISYLRSEIGGSVVALGEVDVFDVVEGEHFDSRIENLGGSFGAKHSEVLAVDNQCRHIKRFDYVVESFGREEIHRIIVFRCSAIGLLLE